MEQLKALLEKKKKEAAEEFDGRKFVRAKDIEEARLKRLRDEEEQDRARKVTTIKHCCARGCIGRYLGLHIHAITLQFA